MFVLHSAENRRAEVAVGRAPTGSRARRDDRATRAVLPRRGPRRGSRRATHRRAGGRRAGRCATGRDRRRPRRAYGRRGAGAITVSPTPGPCTASSSAAVSRTVRLTHSSTPRLLSSRNGPERDPALRRLESDEPAARGRDANDPPPSLAWANGTIPEATAAADPPLDPPGEWSRFHGLRVAPQASGSVVGRLPNSGLLVRPAMTRPAAGTVPPASCRRATAAGRCLNALAAVGQRLPGEVRPQVLEQERHPAKRTVGKVRLRPCGRGRTSG